MLTPGAQSGDPGRAIRNVRIQLLGDQGMPIGHPLTLQPEHKLFAQKFIEGRQVLGDLDREALEVQLGIVEHLAHEVPEELPPAEQYPVEEHKMGFRVDLGLDIREQQRPD